jgi:hypothetical protein
VTRRELPADKKPTCRARMRPEAFRAASKSNLEDVPMLTRTTALTAILTLAGLGFAGSAQAQYFGVEATAQTLGYTGGFTDNSGALFNATFADALSDPTGVTLTSPYYGSVFADVGAAAEARPAELHAQAIAHTHSINAKPGFSGSAPYGYGYGHFFDRLTVKSSVLSKGTPVTIVFGNEVDIATWTYTGLYDGYIDMTLQIGVATARSRWTASYLYGVTAADTPQVRVQTTVGSQLSVDGKLRAQAKTFYYDGAVGFGGDIQADATARLVVREIPTDVTLQSESGIAYPVVPVN